MLLDRTFVICDDLGLGSNLKHSFFRRLGGVASMVFKTQDMRKTAPRLTIFQKLEIVRYAEKLLEERQSESQPKKRKRRRPKMRDWVHGINLQRACQVKFENVIGRIKVCQLRKAAKEQRWEELTERQQKTFYQLPDSLKATLGHGDRLKGWKALGNESLEACCKDQGHLKRWVVPAPVLQD